MQIQLRRSRACAIAIALGTFAVIGLVPSVLAQEAPAAGKADLRPEVAALLKQSTDVYSHMKSYRHTAKWSFTARGPEGDVHEDLNFTLALERPNRFAYKMDTKSQFFAPAAAYCDGKTFINFKARLVPVPSRQYTKVAAPKTYAGINIVDDVEFQPIATYLVALMLQGDVLADKDVRAAMEKASVKPVVTENGKKWQVLEMPFGTEGTPITIYIGQDDHLIGKATQKGDIRITEMIEAVKVDKPVDAAAFQYVLPPDAKQVEHFSAPQRPTDARLKTHPIRLARR